MKQKIHKALVFIALFFCGTSIGMAQKASMQGFSAGWNGKELVLKGSVPSISDRFQLAHDSPLAKSLGKVDYDLLVDPNVPIENVTVGKWGVEAVKELDLGSIEFANGEITVEGKAKPGMDPADVKGRIISTLPASISNFPIKYNVTPAGDVFNSNLLTATRAFSFNIDEDAGKYLAIATLVFPNAVTEASQSRYEKFCTSFTSSLVSTWDSNVRPLSEQITTVWPINNEQLAQNLNTEPIINTNHCVLAVKNHDFGQSQKQILKAKMAPQNVDPKVLDGKGPFLIAWAPMQPRDNNEVKAFVIDLSSYDNSQAMSEFFSKWRSAVEGNRNVWKTGWDDNTIYEIFRIELLNYGDRFLQFVTARYWEK